MRLGLYIFTILCVFVTFLAPPVWANSDPRNSFDPAAVRLTPDEIQKIRTLNPTDYKEYFTIIMSARMRNLPTDEVEMINYRIQSVVFTRTHRIVLYAGVTADGQIIFENLNRSLKNSLLFYFIMTHELEHSLQRYRQGKLLESGQIQYRNVDVDPKYVADTEKSAMQAEWFFLHNVPEAMVRPSIWEVRMAALEVINGTDPILSEFSGRVASAHGNPQEYLESEWKTGRHTETAILKRMLDEEEGRLRHRNEGTSSSHCESFLQDWD